MSEHHRGRGRSGSASRAEVVGSLVAVGALSVGIVALAAGVWPITATVVVIVSHFGVCWALVRGLAR